MPLKFSTKQEMEYCDALVVTTDGWLPAYKPLEELLRIYYDRFDDQLDNQCGPIFSPYLSRLAALNPGEAYIMPVKTVEFSGYIIHLFVPFSRDEDLTPDMLRICYRNCLKLVAENSLKCVAIPLIGVYTDSIPVDQVFNLAKEECEDFLKVHEDVEILLDISDYGDFMPSEELIESFEDYVCLVRNVDHGYLNRAPIEASFPSTKKEDTDKKAKCQKILRKQALQGLFEDPSFDLGERYDSPCSPSPGLRPALSIPFELFKSKQKKVLDESFSEMMLRKIDEAGFRKDSEFYKKANLTKQTFSKMKDPDYHPKKVTAVAVAIALELSMDETTELLKKAGYSLSRSILFDVIIEFCIKERCYNIFDVNEMLYYYDQASLGG